MAETYVEGDILDYPDGTSYILRNNKWELLEESESILEKTQDFLQENLDIPAGIAGAIGGATAGSAVPVVGTIAGGIAGGALGTFGGSLASDYIEDGELDIEEAAEEARDSAIIDVATLGVGRFLRPVASALNVSVGDLVRSSMTKKKPKTPTPTPEALTAGTPESLRQTQELLESGRGSLIATQLENAGRWRKVFDSVGRVGLISKGRLDEIASANSKVLTEEADKMIKGANPNLAMTAGDLGENIYDIITSGRKINSAVYGKGLDSIQETYGNVKVSPQKMLQAVNQFVKDNTVDGLVTLDDATIKIIRDFRKEVTQNRPAGFMAMATETMQPKQSVNKIFALQKKLGDDISKVSDFRAQSYNSVAERQLAQLSSVIRNSLGETLTDVNPRLAVDYKALNKSYADTLDNLLPKINESIVKSADKDDYFRMGQLLLSNSNTSKIKAMMNSIDTAFAKSAKEGLPMTSSITKAADAKQMIRQSYINSMFGDLAGEFDPYSFAGKAQRIDKVPAESEKVKAILGNEAYASLKRLTNAIIESKEQPSTDMFSLMLRGRETAAAAGLIGLGGVTAGVGAIPEAIAIFTIPSVMGLIATNKAAVNRLIAANSQVRKGMNPTPEFIAATTAKILNELNEFDKEIISESISGVIEY